MKSGRLARALAPALLGLVVLGSAGCRPSPGIDTYEALRAAFAVPPAEFRSAPLWVWNDRMTEAVIDEQLEDFREKGIGGVFIHPRPGLITPYLSEEWLALCRHAVETGKSLGMKVWIYDENSYPSGFAGGHVPAAMPDAVLTGLRMRVFDTLPESFDTPPLLVLRRTLTGFEDVTGRAVLSSGVASRFYVFDLVKQAPSPWYGGFTYVDLMRRDVTGKFLEVTLDAYKKAFGEEFGRTVPGVFQDEAEVAPPAGRGQVNYTPALFEAFEARWDYDLRLHLPSLFEDVGDWRRVRHNYYATILDLFIEGWAKPYYESCERNGLSFTGHYWEHAWPVPRVSPDNLAMAAYAHVPGIDVLMNEWGDGPGAQFGNARAVREIRSAANQGGRRRTLSETYGAGGWDLTFLDQKRIGDWEFALGVNLLNQHLSYVTIKGARKRDHPQSFSYHEPWWRHYRFLADYFARLSLALSSGEQRNRVLVLEPTTSGWMHYAPGGTNGRLDEIGNDFQRFIHLLEAEGIEYDLASEKTLEELGSVRRGRLRVGRREYEVLVFPPGLENLNSRTVELVQDYLFQKGRIVSWVSPPDFKDGRADGSIRVLAGGYSDRWMNSSPGSGFDKIRDVISPRIVFTKPKTHPLLFHQRRELRDAQLVFLANADPERASPGEFLIEGGAVEEWDAFTGRVSPYPFERSAEGLRVGYSLPPGGSRLLCVLPTPSEPVPEPSVVSEVISPEGGMRIERDSPNVLTLDYCDLTLDNQTFADRYFYEAQLETFRRHGLDRNPWDSAVQYRTNILDKDSFPPDSGFEAAFRFRAGAGEYLATLRAVVERPDLFSVSVNGHPVPPAPGEWWLDRAFGVYPVGRFVGEGWNTVTVRSRPFTIHSELEPVYLLGNFRLKQAAAGFELAAPEPLNDDPWSSQGMPFYADAVSYRRTFTVSGADRASARFAVRLGAWRGSVAEILVNDVSVGRIAFPPDELEVTDALREGPNEVTVRIFGTLKNTLGPHHNRPPLGRAWPAAFQRGAEGGRPPGADYDFVAYGLFGEYALVRIARK
jgi:hypothetical protein